MKRITACLLTAAWLAFAVCRPAIAEEITAERRAQLERARALVERGLAALEAGDAKEAVDLLQQSRSAAPGAAVPAYDHAVALARAGRLDDALVAYKDALAAAPADVRAAVATRARHNLAGLQLDLARGAVEMLTTPGAIEQAVRAQPGPDGEPMAEGMAGTLALQMRRKIVDEGLAAAKEAVAILRDAVRRDGGDAARVDGVAGADGGDGADGAAAADAVRNLVLAQRARRALEKELQNQQQTEQDEEGDQDDGQDEDSEEGDQGDQGQPDDEGEDQQDSNAGDDEQQEGEQQSGQDGESTEDDEPSSQARQGEPRDVGKEEAERLLQRLLDAAALKARQVEEMKAARLRRGTVEKDW